MTRPRPRAASSQLNPDTEHDAGHDDSGEDEAEAIFPSVLSQSRGGPRANHMRRDMSIRMPRHVVPCTKVYTSSWAFSFRGDATYFVYTSSARTSTCR